MRGHRSCPTRGYGYFNATSIPIFAGSGRPTPRATFAGCSRRTAGASRATQQAHFFQDIAVPIGTIQILAQRNAACLPFAFAKMAGDDQGNPQQNAHKRTAGGAQAFDLAGTSTSTSTTGGAPSFGHFAKGANHEPIRNALSAEGTRSCVGCIAACPFGSAQDTLRTALGQALEKNARMGHPHPCADEHHQKAGYPPSTLVDHAAGARRRSQKYIPRSAPPHL